MNRLEEAMRYLNDPLNWTRTNGILDLLVEHLRISGLAVAAALIVAIPVGALLGAVRIVQHTIASIRVNTPADVVAAPQEA